MTFRSLIVRLYFLNGAFACAYIATVFFTVPSYLLNLIFNMDGEGTLCSWYSSAILLFSALCWALQLEVIRRPVERYLAAVTALSLTVLSIDESVSVHESVSTKLQHATRSPFELTGPVFKAVARPARRPPVRRRGADGRQRVRFRDAGEPIRL